MVDDARSADQKVQGKDPVLILTSREKLKSLGSPLVVDRSRVRDTYEAAQQQKGEFDAEYRIVLQDGTIKHLHTIGRPVLNESGDVVEYVGTGMDVNRATAGASGAGDGLRRNQTPER